jgi:hypothetical protein
MEGSQEASNMKSNSDNEHLGHFFMYSFWPTEACGILGIALQVIGVFYC